MNARELESKVIEKIASRSTHEVDAIGLESTFEELGIDSLNGFDLLCDLEEELGVVIPDDDARELGTVGDIVERVKPLLPASR